MKVEAPIGVGGAHPRIVAVSGKARSGKDTVADFLVQQHGYVRKALADPLKAAAKAVFDLTSEQIYGADKEQIDPYWEASPRTILQKMGNEMRRVFGETIWIKALECSIRAEQAAIRTRKSLRVVISDIRYKNEADAVKSWGGVVWRIERPGAGLKGENAAHISETDLDDYPFDTVIKNDSDLDALYDRLNMLERGMATAAYRARDPEGVKRVEAQKHLKRAYGLSVEEFESIVATQNGRCALCGELPNGFVRGNVPKLVVDHDHETGAMRGVICGACNTGLGCFGDDEVKLQLAIEYLKRSS